MVTLSWGGEQAVMLGSSQQSPRRRIKAVGAIFGDIIWYPAEDAIAPTALFAAAMSGRGEKLVSADHG